MENIFGLEASNYISQNFSLKRMSEEFSLITVSDYRRFLIELKNKQLLPLALKEHIGTGSCELLVGEEGHKVFKCYYYDGIEWGNSGIHFKPEHGTFSKLLSNIEILGLKEYILK